MSDLRIGVIGVSGRMGQEILRIIDESENLRCDWGLDRNKSDAVANVVEDFSRLNGDEIDVVIDFSLPEIFDKSLNWCVENKVPFVCGTTGITEKQMSDLKEAGSSIPVLWAPNMSFGVNLVAKILPMLKALDDFEFQVVEAHHKYKKDAPSGTAKFLEEVLRENLNEKVGESLSLRGGGIFGVHEVWAMGPEEVIKIEHNALNRAVFARGAVNAAIWVSKMAPGQYTVGDVLLDRLKKAD